MLRRLSGLLSLRDSDAADTEQSREAGGDVDIVAGAPVLWRLGEGLSPPSVWRAWKSYCVDWPDDPRRCTRTPYEELEDAKSSRLSRGVLATFERTLYRCSSSRAIASCFFLLLFFVLLVLLLLILTVVGLGLRAWIADVSRAVAQANALRWLPNKAGPGAIGVK